MISLGKIGIRQDSGLVIIMRPLATNWHTFTWQRVFLRTLFIEKKIYNNQCPRFFNNLLTSIMSPLNLLYAATAFTEIGNIFYKTNME